ncbi:MAG: ASCH domain-containing protein [Cyclobacteriaceae bacterium]|jgi:predicted transcriptional regulator|nr:ASCH domain-containing protein [Cyclobacteriaceae bacterium]
MKVMLSIKPEFADKIFKGSKKFEFRRSIFKNPNITKIVVYASSPVQKVIGEFEIDHIMKLQLNELWQKTSRHSGISEDYFYQYFGDKEHGFAIKIKSVKKYKRPLCIRRDFDLTPPQSFAYIVPTKRASAQQCVYASCG